MPFPRQKGARKLKPLVLQSTGALLRRDNFFRVQISGNPDRFEQGTGHKINVQPSALITQSARLSYQGYHIILDYGNILHCIADRVFSQVFTFIA